MVKKKKEKGRYTILINEEGAIHYFFVFFHFSNVCFLLLLLNFATKLNDLTFTPKRKVVAAINSVRKKRKKEFMFMNFYY